MSSHLIIALLSLCLGYFWGRFNGWQEGVEEGAAFAPLELKIQALTKGLCPICQTSFIKEPNYEETVINSSSTIKKQDILSMQRTYPYTSSEEGGGLALQIKLKIYGDANHLIPEGSDLNDFTLPPITNLRDLVSILRIPHYAIWDVRINGQHASLDSDLKDSDLVEIYTEEDKD